MRLWHEKLISKLPRQQLLGQWRECIALLGNGWGKKHSTVDYIFKYPQSYLVAYTEIIYEEMILRGYKPNSEKIYEALRKRLTYNEIDNIMTNYYALTWDCFTNNTTIYPEHNEHYYQECIENLKSKGVNINV